MTRVQTVLEEDLRLKPAHISGAVQLAGKYVSMIWMERESHHVNAKSVIGLLSLELSGSAVFDIIASGPDEEMAAAALVQYWSGLR